MEVEVRKAEVALSLSILPDSLVQAQVDMLKHQLSQLEAMNKKSLATLRRMDKRLKGKVA